MIFAQAGLGCASGSSWRCGCSTSTSSGAPRASNTGSSGTPAPRSSRRRRGRAGRSRFRRWSRTSWRRKSPPSRPARTGACSPVSTAARRTTPCTARGSSGWLRRSRPVSEGLDVPGRDDHARPPAPLRLDTAGRWRVGGRRRRAARARERDARPDDLRAPAAGLRRSHSAGRRRCLESVGRAVRRGCHGPGTARVIFSLAQTLVSASSGRPAGGSCTTADGGLRYPALYPSTTRAVARSVSEARASSCANSGSLLCPASSRVTLTNPAASISAANVSKSKM